MSTIVQTGKRHALAVCIATAFATAAHLASASTHATAIAAVLQAPSSNLVVTNCDDSGSGSLRDAVNNAINGDVIDLTQLHCSLISLTSGAILIGDNDLSLVGPGENKLVIDGSASAGESVLYDLGSGTLTISGMVIEGGSKYESNHAALGGCLHSEGSLNLVDVTVTDCKATATGGSALGGAVFARGEVFLTHSIVSDSHVRSTGYSSGGGIYVLGGFISMYSTITRNYGYAETSTPSFGGGVFARGPVVIQGTEISYNNAIRMGGASFDDSDGYATTIINSTISHNNADAIGGLFVRPALYLYNSTIADNNSNNWTDGTHNFPGGLYIQVPGTIESSIIAGNTSGGAPTATTDLLGAPGAAFSGGHSDVMFCGVPCPNDTAHDDPGLGPLRDNGGFNHTQQANSGAWDTAGGTNLRFVQWDQRGPGFPRQSSGDFPQIGALQENSDLIFVNGFN